MKVYKKSVFFLIFFALNLLVNADDNVKQVANNTEFFFFEGKLSNHILIYLPLTNKDPIRDGYIFFYDESMKKHDFSFCDHLGNIEFWKKCHLKCPIG